ncbi:TPA: AAA family ATPase [Klebsiella pneumoniae]|uniref:AAA family ATPase n=1 Tax=Raoultella ornithinolytica TaxID=54291 RepID=UPI00277C26C9|nr:AAA family ATPase [Klebsiella variicola]HEL6195902.1 AAA family ATPase [Klebsiella pneumoniae]HEL6304690.1 AAA family ATPase [Klebsiella pneumoniae]HEL6496106.1 AAA family ATPase [Klebsiella pneumoniae]HEL7948352.1 AAA family ATPase [Klebsiella pneumoniae]
MTNVNTIAVDALVRNAPVSPALFGINIPANQKVKHYAGFPQGHAFQDYVPALDADYVFEASVRQATLMWFNLPMGQSLWLSGPTGCGKSSIIEQVANRFNWPVMKVTAFPEMDISTQIGGLRITTDPMTGDTKTVFVHGPLAMAYKYGMVYLLDEYDQLESSCANAFNTVLEGGNLIIPETNEVIKKHENFRFVATANSIGQGDTTGMYGGVKMQNTANLDRYMFVNTTYMAPDVEKKIIAKYIPDDLIASKFVQVANQIRKQFVGTEISPDDVNAMNVSRLSVTCSTRSLKAWVSRFAIMHHAKMPQAIITSFDFHIGNRAPADEKKALHTIVESVFGDLAS